jgi:hypothetical protein
MRVSIKILTLLFCSFTSVSVLGGKTLGLNSYKCVQEYSSGFVFSGDKWNQSSFSTISYILRPLGTNLYQYGLYKTDLDEFPSVCEWEYHGTRNILNCKMDAQVGGESFTFSSKTSKYVHTESSAYLDHDGDTPNSVYIELGSCSVIQSK